MSFDQEQWIRPLALDLVLPTTSVAPRHASRIGAVFPRAAGPRTTPRIYDVTM